MIVNAKDSGGLEPIIDGSVLESKELLWKENKEEKQEWKMKVEPSFLSSSVKL